MNTSILTKKQVKTFSKTFYRDASEYLIIATVRYDDECGNGHNTFSITGEIWRSRSGVRIGKDCESFGCLHEEIARHFPHLAPLLKWHLCSSDGPLHYVENTLYFAGDRDCWGLQKGERRQIKNGRTGNPCWQMVAQHRQTGERRSLSMLDTTQDAETCPEMEWELIWISWDTIGEGKPVELDKARRAAIWPEATEEELTAPGLKERLEARLPSLLANFRHVIESLGFTY